MEDDVLEMMLFVFARRFRSLDMEHKCLSYSTTNYKIA